MTYGFNLVLMVAFRQKYDGCIFGKDLVLSWLVILAVEAGCESMEMDYVFNIS